MAMWAANQAHDNLRNDVIERARSEGGDEAAKAAAERFDKRDGRLFIGTHAGLAAGAAIGSVVPIVGTLLGAMVGAAVGGFMAADE